MAQAVGDAGARRIQDDAAIHGGNALAVDVNDAPAGLAQGGVHAQNAAVPLPGGVDDGTPGATALLRLPDAPRTLRALPTGTGIGCGQQSRQLGVVLDAHGVLYRYSY